MPETKQQRIERLLAEGLDLYGMDEVSKAILTWRQVLALDADNREAIDYIKTADRRKHPRPEKSDKTAAAVSAVVREARSLIEAEEFEGALDMLRSAAEADLSNLELELLVDLARSRLYARYRNDIEPGASPLRRPEARDLTSFNLPANAGFLLSLVDGETTVADLITVSGMDSFEALRTLRGLVDAGIVGIPR